MPPAPSARSSSAASSPATPASRAAAAVAAPAAAAGAATGPAPRAGRAAAPHPLLLAALCALLLLQLPPAARAEQVDCPPLAVKGLSLLGPGAGLGARPPARVRRLLSLLHGGYWAKGDHYLLQGDDLERWRGGTAPLNVLLYGDSLDREIVYAACDGKDFVTDYLDRGKWHCSDCTGSCSTTPPMFWRNESFICRRPRFNVANVFSRGVVLGGLHQGMCEQGVPGATAASVGAALREAGARFADVVGAPPDLVLIKSLYWDVTKVFEAPETVKSGIETAYLCDYRAALANAVAEAKAAFPTAMVGLRTDPMWDVTQNRFAQKSAFPLPTVRAAAVNMLQALRGLAREQHLLLIDFNYIFLGARVLFFLPPPVPAFFPPPVWFLSLSIVLSPHQNSLWSRFRRVCSAEPGGLPAR